METSKTSRMDVLFNGFIKENPVLVLLLGTCPTLAVSTTVMGALGMGVAATAVLVLSNLLISLLKDIIPDKVRIPCYIVVIAGFVSVTQLLVEAFAPAIYDVLGIYLPLIVVNCIILGRAEMFAAKNNPFDSILDGIGMGVGFTIALFAMATIREILGAGTWLGFQVLPASIPPMGIMTMAPGGFFTYGIIIALVNRLTKGKAIKRQSFGCEGCDNGCAAGGES